MSEEIELTELRRDARSSIECRLASCRLPSFPQENCLVVSFDGVIEDSNSHESGYGYMHAMIGAGFAACNPAALILDLSGLRYESGDCMISILDQRLVTKVIVGDLNSTGLTSLIESVLFLNPREELFQRLEDALLACDTAYRDFLKDGRKRIIAADF